MDQIRVDVQGLEDEAESLRRLCIRLDDEASALRRAAHAAEGIGTLGERLMLELSRDAARLSLLADRSARASNGVRRAAVLFADCEAHLIQTADRALAAYSLLLTEKQRERKEPEIDRPFV